MGERKGKREINRRALSEKLPSCKIHSASAFETLTARKNAPNGEKKRRGPGKPGATGRAKGVGEGEESKSCVLRRNEKKREQNETS